MTGLDVRALLTEAVEALHRQQHRAARTITLIPSENSSSPLVKLPATGDAGDRYFFPTGDDDPARWPFAAGAEAARIETDLTLPLLRRLTDAAHVNIRPLSGLHAMTVILSALGGPPGTTVITVDPAQGGHYATAALARRLGLRPVPASGPDPHSLDLPALTELVARHRPRLVYLDVCHSLFPLDVPAVVAAVRAAGTDTRVHADASHSLGLILGGALPNPLVGGADSVGGSTHKTLPGPQKGIIATNDREVADLVADTQYDLISSHHLADACALGLALAEFDLADGPGYAREVIAAAQHLGAALHEHGLTPQAPERGYTRSHQLWVRTSPAGVDAAAAGQRLYGAGIHVNVLTDLPGLAGEPALRLGTAEAITVGLNRHDMPPLAGLIADAVWRSRPSVDIAADVAALRAARRPRHRLPAPGHPGSLASPAPTLRAVTA